MDSPAARLIACPRFRWLPGMRVLPDAANKAARCVLATPGGRMVFAVEAPIQMARDNGGPSRLPQADGPVVEAWSEDALTGEELPDLDDPATIGALLGLVREVHGETAHLVRCETHTRGDGPDLAPACWWAVAIGLASVPYYRHGDDEYGAFRRAFAGPTEAEALIAALEGAP